MITVTLLIICLHFATATKSRNVFKCDVSTKIDSGWVCGSTRETNLGIKYGSFRGIPYAQQPLGKLRFKELQPVKHWTHYLAANKEGPVCPQKDVLYGSLVKADRVMSEACIYVNVHVPINALPKTEGTGEDEHSYPIFIFIHGGGFSYGSGDSDLHSPDYLVSKGFIVITFNYRLNVFGFLSLNTHKIPGNAGLRDQLTLLHWVQRNARAFGGDPQEVTLAGQSAGAVSAHLLALSKHSKGLFKRLILMSGTGVPAFYTPSPVYAKEVANKFLKAVGINCTEPDLIYDLLVEMPIEKLMKANSQVLFDVASGTASFMPVIEDNHPGVKIMVDDDPVKLIKQGRDNQYPIIVGITDNECEMFRNRFEEINIIDRIERNPTLILDTRLSYTTTPYLTQYVARMARNEFFPRDINMKEYMAPCRDTLFKYPVFQLAQWRGEMQSAPTYMYQFKYESDYSILKDALNLEYNGNAHVEDLLYVFHPDAYLAENLFNTSSRDGAMKDWMSTIFGNFMRCDEPSCGTGWPPVDPQELNYQSLDQPGVYNNTPPIPEEWDMIHFHHKIHEIAKLILMSGTGVPAFYTPSPVYAKEVANKFLKAVGINCTEPDLIYDLLVEMHIEKLMKANSQVLFDVASGTASFMPVIEDNHPGVKIMVDDDPVKLIKQGRDNQYPIIVGITDNECEMFRNRFEEINIIDRIERNPTLILDTRLSYTTTPYLTQYVARMARNEFFPRDINMKEYMAPCRDTLFKYPVFQLAQWRGEMQSAPTYMYQFKYESDYSILKDALNLEYNGNAHVEDLLYVFHPDAYLAENLFNTSSRDGAMKDWMSTIFGNFMRCDEPSCGTGWPPVDPQELNYQSLDQPGVYNNTPPIPEEWDMIHFHHKIHEIAK